MAMEPMVLVTPGVPNCASQCSSPVTAAEPRWLVARKMEIRSEMGNVLVWDRIISPVVCWRNIRKIGLGGQATFPRPHVSDDPVLDFSTGCRLPFGGTAWPAKLVSGAVKLGFPICFVAQDPRWPF